MTDTRITVTVLTYAHAHGHRTGRSFLYQSRSYVSGHQSSGRRPRPGCPRNVEDRYVDGGNDIWPQEQIAPIQIFFGRICSCGAISHFLLRLRTGRLPAGDQRTASALVSRRTELSLGQPPLTAGQVHRLGASTGRIHRSILKKAVNLGLLAP